MRRFAKPSWRRRAVAGSSASMPSATAMPTPAWCWTRSPGSRKRWRPSGCRPNSTTVFPRPWSRSGARSMKRREPHPPAIDGLGLDDSLAPIRKGARIVKEISWRWREIGADSRICDLIDSQVSAIEASCGQISETRSAPSRQRRVRPHQDQDRRVLRGRTRRTADPDDEKTVPPAADEVMETAAPAVAEPVASAIARPGGTAAEPEVAAAGSARIAALKPTWPRRRAAARRSPRALRSRLSRPRWHERRLPIPVMTTYPGRGRLGEVPLEDAVLDQTGSDQTGAGCRRPRIRLSSQEAGR